MQPPSITTTNGTMPTLLSLPTEILCQIAEHVDGQDLIQMRLVCNSLYYAANKPFGIVYLTHRSHALTRKSIESLLEIVAHHSLGLYVKSITMTACYPLLLAEMPHDHATNNLRQEFVRSHEFVQLMKCVFENICKHQNSVHIGIGYSHERPFFCWSQVTDNRPTLFKPSYNKALGRTLSAAVQANCHVRSLALSMHHYKFDILHDALQQLLDPSRPPLRLSIHCVRKRIRELYHPYTIIYDQADKSLKLIGCDTYELAKAKEQSTIKRTLGFLLSQTTELVFENCYLCSIRTFLALDETLKETLTSVHMRQFSPCRSALHVAREHWSGVLRSLSELGGLKCFVIEDLRLPACWILLHLPSNTDKHEISGEDVADQLKAFAALVAEDSMNHED
ncbi:hypothetical protein KCU93_g8568, partial [Aureobasidium melanogenum]